jgi:hypothetical protein
MKKLCLLLALVLLLAGCGKADSPPPEGKLVSFDVFAINDLHGRMADTQDQPGLDELSAYLKKQSENTAKKAVMRFCSTVQVQHSGNGTGGAESSVCAGCDLMTRIML